MQTIEFTAEETEVLRDILQHLYSEIDVEVFRTDAPGFKQMLKHRREVIQQLLDKVSSPVIA